VCVGKRELLHIHGLQQPSSPTPTLTPVLALLRRSTKKEETVRARIDGEREGEEDGRESV
jgi:hypothetical protein